ncbi:MAG: CHAT domain-containing protein [Streptosporangiales bacterium]|nr:CHAT domain-containing protein [Streptosporangiales bacterium]
MVLADRGEFRAALAEADVAARALRGVDLGYLHTQRALVLSRAGRYDEALSTFARALTHLQRFAEPEWICRVLSNRGALLGYTGGYRAAERDLRRTIELADRHGLEVFSGQARHNLGFISLRTGDVPTALRLFAEAEPFFPAQGHNQAARLLDVADAYLSVRLFRDAREHLEHAVDVLAEGGFAVDVAEAQVLLARTHLLDHAAGAAARTASEAAAEFRRQRRPGWTALADHLALYARVEAGESGGELLGDLRSSARRLGRRGWAHAAVHSHVLAGAMAHELGDRRVARVELDHASRARHRGPIAVRAPAWYATALRRLVDADERGALRAARAGLGVVDDYAATLGATDLRVRASGWGEDLATLGVRLTKESGDGWRYLTWVERWRANALRRPPVRPPHDPRLARDLAQLRRVTADLATCSARGDDTRPLTAEQVRLERAVRDRSRVVTGPSGRSTGGALDRAELRELLGDRALVELADHDGTLVAVTFAAGRCRLHELGPFGAAATEMDSLRFSLHRLARRHGSAASLAAAEAGVAYSGRQLDAMLLAPLREAIGDRELVIAPSDALHALPWSALPSLRDTTVSVVPSVTMWVSATRRLRSPSRGRGVVVVAGPGLDHSAAEVRAVARHHRGVRRLTGRRATVAATLDAIDGASTVHIAAHGRFRFDNPQFSALDLDDGPLTVYDLERISRAPRRLVLSACDTALSAVHPGDELQGVAAAFLSLGTSTLVASVTPVADNETRTLMGSFHRRLAAGASPGRALAEAETTTGTLGFVCFGASE